MLQYTDNIQMLNSNVDSKDCFWHAKNVYCKNCKLIGMYFAWYSENWVFENCHIDTMPNCDGAFENSEVDADIKGHLNSIRNFNFIIYYF